MSLPPREALGESTPLSRRQLHTLGYLPPGLANPRAEAEREFAFTRLSKLRLSWDAFSEIDSDLYAPGFGVREFTCAIDKTAFQGLCEDASRVTFSFNIKCQLEEAYTMLILTKNEIWNCGPFTDVVLCFLNYRDMVQYSYIHHRAEHGNHANETPLPNLEVNLDNQTLTFGWKTFFNNFYGDMVYVQRRN